MKRKLFIALVLAVFALYCYGAGTRYAYVPVPQYRDVKIDLMRGMSPRAWAKDPTAQNEHFKELSEKHYQPVETGLHFQSGMTFTGDHVFTEQDLRAILAAEPVLSRALPVRDPVDLERLAEKARILRDDVYDEGKPVPGLKQLTVVDKKVLDQLINLGIDAVRMCGQGEMVAPQSGTMLMVVLVFLGLLCALDLALFEPLVRIVDIRNAETEAGVLAAKSNKKRAKELEEESLRRRKEMRRDHMGELIKARHGAMKEADAILQEANVEGHRLRDNAHMEMKKAVADAESRLREEVSGLADDVVKQILGKQAGGRA